MPDRVDSMLQMVSGLSYIHFKGFVHHESRYFHFLQRPDRLATQKLLSKESRAYRRISHVIIIQVSYREFSLLSPIQTYSKYYSVGL